MSKRAEQAALKAYPVVIEEHTERDVNKPRRLSYIKGYEQAEKETIERAAEWLSSIDNGTIIVDVKAFVNAFRNEMEEE